MERDELIKWILDCCAQKNYLICATACPLEAREGCIEEMADMALARIEALEDEIGKKGRRRNRKEGAKTKSERRGEDEMDLIDRRSLLELYANPEDGELTLDNFHVPVAIIRANIRDMPTVDAVPVIRCRDCGYAKFDRWHKAKEDRPPVWRCRKFGRLTVPDGFCHKGKIREEDQNATD